MDSEHRVVSSPGHPHVAVTDALNREMEAMTRLNGWLVTELDNPARDREVPERLRRVNAVHQHVLAAYQEWRAAGVGDALIAACDQYIAAVDQFIGWASVREGT
jgi:hypothetical protein